MRAVGLRWRMGGARDTTPLLAKVRPTRGFACALPLALTRTRVRCARRSLWMVDGHGGWSWSMLLLASCCDAMKMGMGLGLGVRENPGCTIHPSCLCGKEANSQWPTTTTTTSVSVCLSCLSCLSATPVLGATLLAGSSQ